MKKEEILNIIKRAQKEIDNMVENARLIMDGVAPQYESIPEDPQKSEFGQWFYSEGQQLCKLSNNPMECLQNIELLHKEFHKVYYEIYTIYTASKPKGGLLKIFSKKEELPKEKLEALVEKLENSHKELAQELLKMERRIQATPQEKFDLLSK